MSTAERTRRLAALEAHQPDARPNPQATAALAWLLAEYRATHPELVHRIESAPPAERPAAIVDLLQAAPGSAQHFFSIGRDTQE